MNIFYIFMISMILSGCSVTDKILNHPHWDNWWVNNNIANFPYTHNSTAILWATPGLEFNSLSDRIYLRMSNSGDTIVFMAGSIPTAPYVKPMIGFTKENYQKEIVPIKEFIKFIESDRTDFSSFSMEVNSINGFTSGLIYFNEPMKSKYSINLMNISTFKFYTPTEHTEVTLLVYLWVKEGNEGSLQAVINYEQAKRLLEITDDWYEGKLNPDTDSRLEKRCGWTCN
ncbi:hypothetical protein [Limnobaculum xujianqingii]|nr:hypothetical protein [Limnobaculum xujianqingii]